MCWPLSDALDRLGDFIESLGLWFEWGILAISTVLVLPGVAAERRAKRRRNKSIQDESE